LRAGYILSNFSVPREEGGLNFLKTFSFVYVDKKYGAMIFDTGSPYKPEEIILPLKQYFGLSPDDIKWVFITHIHPDHIGLNSFFRKAKLIFSAKDYEVADEIADVALSDKDLYTFLNQKFENYNGFFKEFDAVILKELTKKFWSKKSFGFDLSHSFIEDNPDIPPFVKIIPTFGHTLYHYSYLIESSHKNFYVTGDALSNRLILNIEKKENLVEAEMDAKKYLETIQGFKNFKGIFVPGHDRPFNSNTLKGIRENVFDLSLKE